MSKIPSLMDMLKAGVHFGHQRSRWHPKMKPFIFGVRNGVHVIDLDKTQEELAKALAYVKNLAAHGKIILFVGTKRQARDLIKAAAERCGMPYIVERWIGGLLTNFDEFKRRLKKYKHLQEMIATGEIEKYVKKEQVKMKKQLAKMDKYLRGLVSLERLPDALYVSDVRVEKTAVTEARRRHVPMVAVCDSNVNPLQIDYPIPANDDAVKAIQLVADLVADAIVEGTMEFEKNKAALEADRVVVSKETETAESVKPLVKMTKQIVTEVPAKQAIRALRKEEVV